MKKAQSLIRRFSKAIFFFLIAFATTVCQTVNAEQVRNEMPTVSKDQNIMLALLQRWAFQRQYQI